MEQPSFTANVKAIDKTSNPRIVIIGGGVVGLATAYQLLHILPHIRVTVLEKELTLGHHQTGNNSGVLHAGLYYQPGSAKARLAVQGIQSMVQFCQQNQIAHEVCGKLVVATDESQLSRLRDLWNRGQQNGLLGLRWLQREELQEIEPYVQGIAGIHVPQEGIVNYKQVCERIAYHIQNRGGCIQTGAAVTQLQPQGLGWSIQSSAGSFNADLLVNCAGLFCDRVSQLAGEPRQVRIIPFRGEYYKIKPERQYLVKNLIYPVPDPKFPFLGVHFTRMIQGGIEAGPNAVLAFAREGYRKSQVNAGDLWDVVSYPGFWRFTANHWQMGLDEFRRSLSKQLFCKSLQTLVPTIQESDLESGGAGVRAQAIYPNGNLVQDFYILSRSNAIHVLNAPSPAATASLAIGAEIADYITQRL